MPHSRPTILYQFTVLNVLQQLAGGVGIQTADLW